MQAHAVPCRCGVFQSNEPRDTGREDFDTARLQISVYGATAAATGVWSWVNSNPMESR